MGSETASAWALSHDSPPGRGTLGQPVVIVAVLIVSPREQARGSRVWPVRSVVAPEPLKTMQVSHDVRVLTFGRRVDDVEAVEVNAVGADEFLVVRWEHDPQTSFRPLPL